MSNRATTTTQPVSCLACSQPITSTQWDGRHDISDTDAQRHRLDAGDYHDRCCPHPTCAATTPETVT